MRHMFCPRWSISLAVIEGVAVSALAVCVGSWPPICRFPWWRRWSSLFSVTLGAIPAWNDCFPRVVNEAGECGLCLVFQFNVRRVPAPDAVGVVLAWDVHPAVVDEIRVGGLYLVGAPPGGGGSEFDRFWGSGTGGMQ